MTENKIDYANSKEYENHLESLIGFYGSNDYNVGNFEELKEQLLYKRVIEWDDNHLILDDGTIVTVMMTEWDCCASAGGEFDHVELDAAITDVVLENVRFNYNEEYEEGESTAVLKLYHNQNEYATHSSLELYANDGNAGFYYSVASLVIKDVVYPVLESGDGQEEERYDESE